jgi:O-succinylbenzoate synthase
VIHPPDLEELLAAAVPFAVALRVPFRGVSVRDGLLLKGPSGWGEFAPFDDYDDSRAGRWLEAAIEAAWGQWPAPRRESIEVNAIVPAVDSRQAGALAREAIWEYGCRSIKVKVGSGLAEDEARVVAIRDALDSAGIDTGIRLDANAAWSLDQALASMRRLVAYGIEFVEQPCADLDDVARVRAQIDVAVAVDEGIRLADAPEGVTLDGVADYAVCKPMTLGGAAATLRVAESIGVPVVISGSLDTGVGLATSIAAAAALEDLPLASGLGTGALLASDLTDPPLRPLDGRLPVQRVAPDLQALVRASDAIDPDRAAWWRKRLASAYATIAQAADREVEG